MEFPEQITTGILFFWFAYLAILGLLQVLAVRHRRRDLSRLARSLWGYPIGLGLMFAGFLWFFGTKGEEIMAPGPASSEFTFFLSLALVLALLTSVLPARLVPDKEDHHASREES